MATLTIREAQVLPDGRTVRVLFEAVPAPALHTVPDWMPGYSAGVRLRAQDGGECQLLGAMSVEWNVAPPGLLVRANASSAIAAGKYYYRYTFVDSEGIERITSGLGGAFSSMPQIELVVGAGQEVVVIFNREVPAGMTARIYGSATNGQPETMRLVMEGIPAGSTEAIVTSSAFIDGSRVPDSRRCWVSYWLLPESSRVIYLQEGVSISAGHGLLSDSAGNNTEAFEQFLVENRSIVEADGWTTNRFTRSANGLELYVSSTHGNDANPGTLLAPLRSPTVAINRLPKKSGSVVRFLRGDVFVTEKLNSKAGPDGEPQSPLILEDYWHDYVGGQSDPGVRPILDFSNASSKYLMVFHGGFGPRAENLLIRRLHMVNGGFSCNTGGQNIYHSDCVYDNGTLANDANDAYRVQSVMLHRCIVFDNRAANFGGRAQGSHGHDTDLYLISECTYDRNGYPAPDFSLRDVYSHNVYLQNGVNEAIMWGCWLLRGGSHGVQMRGGGAIAFNVFSRNAIGGQFNRQGGYIRKNTYIQSEDLIPGARGFGPGGSVGYGESAHSVVIEFNVIAYHNATGPRGIVSGNGAVAAAEKKKRYEVLRHNMIFDHGRCVFVADQAPHIRCQITRNVLIASSSSVNAPHALYFGLASGQSSDLGWLDSNENVLWTYNAQNAVYHSRLSPTNMSFANWRSVYGKDTESLVLDGVPQLANPDYRLGDFSLAQGGPADEAGLVQVLRTRPPMTWGPIYQATLATEAFAAAFMPVSLPAVNSGLFGFYGHADYRDANLVRYEISGPSVGMIGEWLTFWVSPSRATTDSVTLTDGLAGGTFMPSTLSWTDEGIAKSFQYRPAAAGSVTLAVWRGSELLDTKTLSVRRKRALNFHRRRVMQGGYSSHSMDI